MSLDTFQRPHETETGTGSNKREWMTEEEGERPPLSSVSFSDSELHDACWCPDSLMQLKVSAEELQICRGHTSIRAPRQRGGGGEAVFRGSHREKVGNVSVGFKLIRQRNILPIDIWRVSKLLQSVHLPNTQTHCASVHVAYFISDSAIRRMTSSFV